MVAPPRFALFKDGQGVASTAETSYTFTELSCGTAYTLGIEALDSAGNRSDLVSVTAATDACPTPAPATHLRRAASSSLSTADRPRPAAVRAAPRRRPRSPNDTGQKSRAGGIIRRPVGQSRSLHLARDRRRT